MWTLWDANVSLAQLQESAYVMCWAASWLGEDEVMFDSLSQSGRKKMLRGIHQLLEEADAVVHWNGIRHDIPLLNKEFLENKMVPPAPFKQIDLLQTSKKVFKFPSNKLEYVCRALGVKEKLKTIGHELWTRCMAEDKEAWKMMKEYNINDVVILKDVYARLLPWVKGHTNYSMLNETSERVCPRCGGTRHQKRGYTYTNASKFQRFQCVSCGGWFKDNQILNKKQYKTSEII